MECDNDLRVEIFMPIYIDGELTNYIISDYGRCINTKTNKEKKPWIGKKGKRVYLDIKYNGRKHTKQLSRWMALSFLELPEGLTYDMCDADHKDEEPLHNHLSNIQWLSKGDNSAKSNLAENIKYTGEVCVNSKLTSDNVHCIIKDVLYNNTPYRDIISKYNISPGTLCDIMNGRTWKPIYNQYDMTNYIKRKRKQKNANN